MCLHVRKCNEGVNGKEEGRGREGGREGGEGEDRKGREEDEGFVCHVPQEQNELVWKIRDQLKAELTMSELKQLLQANGQSLPTGESKVSMVTQCTCHI